jgi:hypothetical protein
LYRIQSELELIPAPAKPLRLTPEGVLKHVAELTVMDEQALSFIGKPSFCKLVGYLSSGKITEKQIASRTTLSRELNSQYYSAMKILISKLKVRYPFYNLLYR